MKRLVYILFGLLWLVYGFAYSVALSHVLFYHEQHHLFLFSSAYFEHCIESEGGLGYATNFLIQFFHVPFLGSALLALCLALVYLLAQLAIRRLTGKYDLLQLSVLPSLLLFLHTMEASHSLQPVVGTLLALLALHLVLFLLKRFTSLLPLFPLPPIPQRKLSLAVVSLALLVYAAYGSHRFYHAFNHSERIMLRAEQAVKARQWDEVLTFTGRYLASGRSNQLISYFHHLALYHQGQLFERLLEYPQRLGVQALYFPWNSDSRESEYGHFLYEDLGYLNEAQRWEFESMVVWGETAPHLRNLARYNIAIGRPRVAQRFLNRLKQSMFYRSEAHELETLRDSGRVPGLHNALAGVEDVPARFANVMNIGPELQYLCEHDSTNRMAYEYLMCQLLLSNHVVRFVDNLNTLANFAPAERPALFEEALYIYRLGIGEEKFAETGLTLRPETARRFQRYYGLLQSKQMETLRQEFARTYWYYLNFLSPYGNKVLTD